MSRVGDTANVAVIAEPILPEAQAPARQSSRAWRHFRRHRLALVGSAIMLFLVLVTALAPLTAPKDPLKTDAANARRGPAVDRILGTDGVGRDVLSRLIHGGRVSLSVGLVAVAISVSIGTLLGLLSGYYGGFVDDAIMRFTEAVMCFPGLVLIITAVSLVGPSIYNVMVILGLLGWPGTCRLVRGQVLSLREREFVLSARMLGAGDSRIVFRHILPNVLSPVIVAGTFGVAGAILTETSLSFLGLGVQAPTPSWGNMLNAAQGIVYLESMPWLWLPPGLAIAISVISINFIGDALRDALDPRSIR